MSKKYKSPLSSADAAAILDALDDGKELEEIVEPELISPISEWLLTVTKVEMTRRKRDD